MQRGRIAQVKRRGDTLNEYLHDINGTALLTADEEVELSHGIKGGNAGARERMIKANLRLVVNIARQFVNKGLSMEDLIGEGNMGLIRAVEGFDPSHGTRFSTYAAYWIKQSMQRASLNHNRGKAVRLPVYVVDLLRKYRRQESALRKTLGRTPSLEEVGRELGFDKKKLKILAEALRAREQTRDVGDDSQTVEDAATDPVSLADAVDTAEHVARLAEVLARWDLTEATTGRCRRHATVLRMRFGLSPYISEFTLQEAGRVLSLTRERVRQIESEALRLLRADLTVDARNDNNTMRRQDDE